MADIAARAQVAEGTLYLYFGNKEALARAVLSAFYERLTARAQEGAARRRTTASRLAFLARHHLENIIRERRLLELISTADRDPETYEGTDLYKMNRAYVAVFDGVVRDGRWRGDLADDQPLWLVRDLFFGGLEYAMRTILMKRRVNGKDVDRTVSGLVSLLVANGAGTLRTEKDERAPPSLSPAEDNACSAQRFAAIAGRLEDAAARLEALADDSGERLRRKARRHDG